MSRRTLIAAVSMFAVAGVASAQVTAVPAITAPLAAAPSVPAATPPQIAAPAARVEAHWTVDAARSLIEAIAAASDEGLDAAPYRADLVKAALADGEGPALDQAARTAALALANDYFGGRVTDKAQFDWHIERSPYLAMQLPAQLDAAVATGPGPRVARWTAAPGRRVSHAEDGADAGG